MHIISWNVRGANGDKKKRMIRKLRNMHKPDMVFLQETKMVGMVEKSVNELWGNEQVRWSAADVVGRSGGLMIMWNPEFFQCLAETKGRGFIHVKGKVISESKVVEINYLNVYAPVAEKDKLLLWEELTEVRNASEGGWIIGGDFNAVLYEEERRGSTFNSKVADQVMGVMDLPMAGRQFTWSNRSGVSRLDRFLVSPEVVSLWPKLKQWG
ncbi:unnamed protein product [Rhodiola kirilowii]